MRIKEKELEGSNKVFKRRLQGCRRFRPQLKRQSAWFGAHDEKQMSTAFVFDHVVTVQTQ